MKGLTFDPGPHVYRWQGEVVPSVTQVQGAAGLSPDYDAIPAKVLQTKALIGTLTHELLDAQISGDAPPDVPARVAASDVVPASEEEHVLGRIAGYFRAGQQFLEDMNLRIEASEQRLYSEVYGYAGTVDVVALWQAFRGIFDWKTTSSIHPVAVGTQTTGYQILWNENNPSRKVQRRFAVQLHEDGSWKLHPMDDPADRRRWLSAVAPDGKDPVLEHARAQAVRRAVEFL